MHASTGITPFWANYQQNPLTPAVFIKMYNVKQASSVKATEDLLQDSNAIIRIIQNRLRISQERQAKNANKRRREETFKEGDKVLIDTHLALPSNEQQRRSKKLSARFMRPYTIEKVISPNAYKLNLPMHLRIHPVVNIQWLKNLKKAKWMEDFNNHLLLSK
jgi:hypothetical protein